MRKVTVYHLSRVTTQSSLRDRRVSVLGTVNSGLWARLFDCSLIHVTTGKWKLIVGVDETTEIISHAVSGLVVKSRGQELSTWIDRELSKSFYTG